jgi:hypothetical protein
MFCGLKSAAGKRYVLTVSLEMAAYVLIMSGVSAHVNRYHPAGVELYLLAALPSFPIIGVLVAIGIYLRDQRDEYQRVLMVKCVLWGTGGVLALTAFLGFLRGFGWKGTVPPFTEFVTFWILVGAAKAYYRLTNRVSANE